MCACWGGAKRTAKKVEEMPFLQDVETAYNNVARSCK